MKRPVQRRFASLLVMPFLVWTGCGGRDAGISPGEDPQPLPPEVVALVDPGERLEAILALGREPGRLPISAWQEAERALVEYLPDLGALEGMDFDWRIVYTDLPAGDYLAVDLLEGEGDAAIRHAWFHVVYLPEPLEGEAFDGPPLRGFPTAGIPGRYLRLRAGSIDLLAVPEIEDLKNDRALRELVGRFDLEGLAELGGGGRQLVTGSW